MSEYMTVMPFDMLMEWLLKEKEQGRVFGLHRPFIREDSRQAYKIFGEQIETPFGPAAGPNTQLTQNIVASYYGGARFFELKTVQKIDGEDLAKCISRPCITANDECYNCEWSTELKVSEAMDEYIKAWFMLKFMATEYALGDPNGFVFNMSVGYDLEGIKLKKVDDYIEGMKNAENTEVFKTCKKWLQDNLHRFKNFKQEHLYAITPKISASVTLSTLHGCPPDEIERIAMYLLTEKNVHTFIKCNPTLLGYEYARETLDNMGYDYIQFTDFHFKDDLQYSDAVPMLQRLQATADEKHLEFGVKITNTFPVDVKANELPSEEMYMSGKSLAPLSLSVARNLTRDFNGKLKISFSGGADAFNIDEMLKTGIWPITVATTLLKPGGYERFRQLARNIEPQKGGEFDGVDLAKVEKLLDRVKKDRHHVKAIKPLPSRTIGKQLPLVDCFTAPCEYGCPIHQDIPMYLKLTAMEKYDEAIKVITEKNALPFMTGVLCAHNCMTKCTRNFYEEPVDIRGVKLTAAEHGLAHLIDEMKTPDITSDKKVAIVGGGPAGLSAGYFLARAGISATIFERMPKMGGAVRNVIPEFRISHDQIDMDIKLIEKMGVKLVNNKEITDIGQLKKEYDYVVVAVGASKSGVLKLEKGDTINALHFLKDSKDSKCQLELGERVIVIGGGNTAMDVARAAKRNKGVKDVAIVYRRTKRYMPADEEELVMAIEDGVRFEELLSPVSFENKKLVCKKMKLGDFDETGRRGIVETDEVVTLDVDTVIASVGEQVPTEFYQSFGLDVDKKGKAIVNPQTYESSVKDIFVVGDGCGGAATIVEGIRDGKMAAEAIAGRILSKDYFDQADAAKIYERKSNLLDRENGACDGMRCLACDSYCENCVSVCPNRANIAVIVEGKSQPQIVHVDHMCNECGNCETFCPYDSAPYKHKFTLFPSVASMDESTNEGFALADRDKGICKVRLDNEMIDYTVGSDNASISADLRKIIDTIVNDYAYMIL